MRARPAIAAVLGVFFSFGVAQAQDLPTTHDFGITITPDDLTTSIQETQDFWGPVRKHLLSADCTLATIELRTEAAAFLKSLHDAMHDQLFGKGEPEAHDLIQYLGHRMRMFEVYRRLRTAVGDDAALVALIGTWQYELRNVHKLPAAERAAPLAALPLRMVEEMKSRGLDEQRTAEAAKLWALQADVDAKMAGTLAGAIMIDFENKAAGLDVKVAETLRHISEAADWVLIIRETGREIGRADFLAANAYLTECRGKQAAAVGGAIAR